MDTGWLRMPVRRRVRVEARREESQSRWWGVGAAMVRVAGAVQARGEVGARKGSCLWRFCEGGERMIGWLRGQIYSPAALQQMGGQMRDGYCGLV